MPGHTNPANEAVGEDFPYNVNISDIGESYIPGTNYTSKCVYCIATLNIATVLIVVMFSVFYEHHVRATYITLLAEHVHSCD